MRVVRHPLVGGLDWWFGFGFEPLAFAAGTWETPPFHHQATNPDHASRGFKLLFSHTQGAIWGGGEVGLLF